MRRILREPLLHFALLGAGLFAAHAAFAPELPTDAPARIELEDTYLDALVAREALGGGEVDREEVARRWIRDEAMAREARRLGLAERDPIIRRRLVQKMELWIETHVEIEEPDEAALAAELDAHPERYRRPPMLAFEHLFFAAERVDPAADARAALAALPEDISTIGDSFLLGRSFDARPRARVADRFGEAFAAALGEAPEDTWAGPIESPFGQHLVRVTTREPGALPPLSEVRDAVRQEVVRELRAEAARALERELIERYEVVRDRG